MLQKSEVTTTTDDPFSPLFETAARRTHRGWCLQYMGPNQGRTSVTRWSLFDHSGPLILSEKPSIMPIDSNHRNTRHRQFPGEYRHYSARQHGDSGRTRTPNLLIRSQLLYPVELRNHAPWNEDIILVSLISSAQFCASFSNESPVAGGPVLPT